MSKMNHEDDLVPIEQVIADMNRPDGGLISLAARDYYYLYYASEKEKRKMDCEDKLQTIIAIIFLIIVFGATAFVLLS